MEKNKLTKKQLETMKIFWSADKPLAVSEIVQIHPSLNINTVRVTTSFLRKNGYIKEADVIMVGKSLARTYSPIISEDEYVAENFSNIHQKLFSKAIFSNFVEQEKDQKVLEELQAILEKRQQELQEESSHD